MSVKQAFKISIKSELEHVALVGAAINKVCTVLPLSQVDAFQTELCIVEAVNNCIKHAYDNKSEHEVEVSVNVYLDRVIFEVRDTGKLMPERGEPSLDFDPANLDQLPEGGMGLFIMNEIMDKVEHLHDEGTNIVRMIKRFSIEKEEVRI